MLLCSVARKLQYGTHAASEQPQKHELGGNTSFAVRNCIGSHRQSYWST